ncbi:MAG: acyl-CoA thioesterase [Flavihumibacter sp.]
MAQQDMTQPSLSHSIELAVRFNEADPLGIVWHGHYVRYFEDGREAFGQAYGLSYLDIYHNGYSVPIVKVQCDYKKSLRYGDSMLIETVLYRVSPPSWYSITGYTMRLPTNWSPRAPPCRCLWT